MELFFYAAVNECSRSMIGNSYWTKFKFFYKFYENCFRYNKSFCSYSKATNFEDNKTHLDHDLRVSKFFYLKFYGTKSFITHNSRAIPLRFATARKSYRFFSFEFSNTHPASSTKKRCIYNT